MKKSNIQPTYFLVFALLFTALIACNKDEEDKPVGTEAINFIQPDSTTIIATAGELVDFSLYLAIDAPIDSVRGAYFIDTVMNINNLTYNDMQTEFFVQVFTDSLNVQTVSGTLQMPLGRNASVPFQPYFTGSTTPFIAQKYDAVRVVFRLDSDNLSYEKQLKIIVN